NGTQGRGKGVEHTIADLRAFPRAVSPREPYGFLNDDTRRRLTTLQLGGAESQHTPIDHAETLEPPVGGDVGQLVVELRAMLHDGVDQRARPFALFGWYGEVVPDLRRHPLELGFTAEIPCVERL